MPEKIDRVGIFAVAELAARLFHRAEPGLVDELIEPARGWGVADAFGLKFDSILAVASMYSKLAPVLLEDSLMEVAILRRDGSLRN